MLPEDLQSQIDKIPKDILPVVEFHRGIDPGIVSMACLVQVAMKEMNFTRYNRDIFIVCEINRCHIDSIQILTGCTIGNRRLRVKNFGKWAMTVFNVKEKKAVRFYVKPGFPPRDFFKEFKPGLPKHEIVKIAQRAAFKLLEIPPEEYVRREEVRLKEKIKSTYPPTEFAFCEQCGERVSDGLLEQRNGKRYCKGCLNPYYRKIRAIENIPEVDWYKNLKLIKLDSHITNIDIPEGIKSLIEFHGGVDPAMVMMSSLAQAALKKMETDCATKSLFAFVENARCHSDAIQWFTGCTAGNRRLFIKDYGKTAFTLIDPQKNRAVRAYARPGFPPLEDRREFKKGMTKLESRRIVAQAAKRTWEIPPREYICLDEVKILESIPLPYPCTIFQYCDKCGELVMDGLTQSQNGRKYCQGCLNPYYEKL